MLTLGYNFWTEWELQEKVDFDGINKLIIVYPHVTTLDIREDVWSAWVRWHDMQDRGYDRFLLAMDRSGLETIPNGQTGDYYFLKNGWKLLVDLSKVAISGVMYSRDYQSPYFTPDEVVQFPAQVSSVVNAVTLTQNVVTGDISDAPSVSEISEGTLNAIIEGATSLRESIRLQNSVMLSKVSGVGAGIETFRDIDDTKDRVVAVIDGSGNRTAITLDKT